MKSFIRSILFLCSLLVVHVSFGQNAPPKQISSLEILDKFQIKSKVTEPAVLPIGSMYVDASGVLYVSDGVQWVDVVTNSIANGGTGADNASDARINLGLSNVAYTNALSNFTLGLQVNGSNVYHAGNANLSTIDWNSQNIIANGSGSFVDDLSVSGSNSSVNISGDGNAFRLQALNTNFGNYFRLRDNANGEDGLRFYPNGRVELCYNGSEKIETTGSGVSVVGRTVTDNLSITGLFHTDGQLLSIGSSGVISAVDASGVTHSDLDSYALLSGATFTGEIVSPSLHVTGGFTGSNEFKLYQHAGLGSAISTQTGGIYDFTIANPAGQGVMHMPTGTQDILFLNDVTVDGNFEVNGSGTSGFDGHLAARTTFTSVGNTTLSTNTLKTVPATLSGASSSGVYALSVGSNTGGKSALFEGDISTSGDIDVNGDGRFSNGVIIGDSEEFPSTSLSVRFSMSSDFVHFFNEDETSNSNAVFRVDARSDLDNSIRVQRNGVVQLGGVFETAASGIDVDGDVTATADINCIDVNYSGILNQTSDKRIKDSIQSLVFDEDKFLKLNPVSYYYRYDKKKSIRSSYLAQELELLYPNLVNCSKSKVIVDHEVIDISSLDSVAQSKITDNDRLHTIDPISIIPLNTKAIQECIRDNNDLKLGVESLKLENESLKLLLQNLSDRVEALEN